MIINTGGENVVPAVMANVYPSAEGYTCTKDRITCIGVSLLCTIVGATPIIGMVVLCNQSPIEYGCGVFLPASLAAVGMFAIGYLGINLDNRLRS